MKTLLIADDDEDIRMVFRLRLERTYRILEAASGADVLEVARTDPPDLIILDWTMPGVNGLELIEKLRDEPAMGSVPVVVLTGDNHRTERGRLRDLGVESFLLKPVTPGQLESTIQAALSAETDKG